MTNKNSPNDDKKQTQEEFSIQRIYSKDISFETPNSPLIFKQKWEPKVALDIDNNYTKLDNELYDVYLKATVTVKVGDKIAFLCEINQAGIFTLKNFDNQRLDYILKAYIPNVLFAYLREGVNTLVTKGSFPPLHLSPINFDALYQAKKEKQKSTIN